MGARGSDTHGVLYQADVLLSAIASQRGMQDEVTHLSTCENTRTDPNGGDFQCLRNGLRHRIRHALYHHGKSPRLLYSQSVLHNLLRLDRRSPLSAKSSQHAFRGNI